MMNVVNKLSPILFYKMIAPKPPTHFSGQSGFENNSNLKFMETHY